MFQVKSRETTRTEYEMWNCGLAQRRKINPV
jgi:hypothetical protein